MKHNLVKWKVLSFLLALVLQLSCGVSSFAENVQDVGRIEAEESETAGDRQSAEETETSDWETRLLLMLAEHDADPATITAGYYNFATGEEHYYNGDEYRVSGSMYKVPLNMKVLDLIAEGTVEPDEMIYGYRYTELLEGSIIDSNNDYAQTLWTFVGNTIQTEPASTPYHRYRILIAPLMGEDPDNVDEKYYENNFFTARQMITCLRNLYDGGSRYDRLIDAMQRAEPERYFKLRERRFNIAHKYGWFAEGDTLYMNDCALCFTDDPIAIVLFTTGTQNAYGVLTDFCTLMCDYAQEQHAVRIAREEAEAAAAAEAAERDRLAAQSLEGAVPDDSVQTPGGSLATQSPAQPREGEVGVSSSHRVEIGPLVTIILILLATLAAICALVLAHKKQGLRPVYSIAAMLITASALLLCFPAANNASYIRSNPESARETAEAFIQAIENRDAVTADACLAETSGLGLAGRPDGELHAVAWQALQESWRFNLIGNCSVDKTIAWQEAQLRVLDFSAMERELQLGTREQLLELSGQLSRAEMYDESGNYRQEVAEQAYDRALSELLEHPTDYYRSVGIRLELTMTRDGWKIVPTRELLSALSGNPE